MVKVVVVNGKPGCGKTAFEELCKRSHPFSVKIISTVTFVKRVAKFCGWDGNKTPENRKFLSDLKYLLAAWNDVPYKHICKVIKKYRYTRRKYVVFVDSREPAEIERLKKDFDALTVLVRRPGDTTITTSNSADEGVFNYEYDMTIKNDSDMIELQNKAKTFMKNIRRGEFV